MLKISQRLEYAMRAMIELSSRPPGTLVSARQIATAQQIPLRFLEQQLGALHKARLVESFRGAGGGCRLARPATEISVADIADAVEGQLYPMFCLEPSDHTCYADSRCGLQGFWGEVAGAIDRVFRETSVHDLAERQQRSAKPSVFTAEQLVSRLS